MKVLLACDGGMSSAIVVRALQEAATKENIEMSVHEITSLMIKTGLLLKPAIDTTSIKKSLHFFHFLLAFKLCCLPLKITVL